MAKPTDDKKARAAIGALADFIKALGPLTGGAETARRAALDAARACGWEG